MIKDQNQVGVCGEVNGEKEWENSEKERKTMRKNWEAYRITPRFCVGRMGEAG